MPGEDKKTKPLSSNTKQYTDQTTKRNTTGDWAYQKIMQRYPIQKGVQITNNQKKDETKNIIMQPYEYGVGRTFNDKKPLKTKGNIKQSYESYGIGKNQPRT